MSLRFIVKTLTAVVFGDGFLSTVGTQVFMIGNGYELDLALS